MRLLILGLGTAGSKIADAIIRPSGHSARCSDLHAIAVDNDPEVLEHLSHIGEEAKFYFPKDDIEAPELLTTRFTIDEVKSKLKGFDVGTHDAVLICAGLGGGLISLVPHLVSIIRETMFEPVFALVTIPTEDEGESRLIRAMKNLQMIRPLVDGVIIFDNQLWLDKARGELAETTLEQRPVGIAEKFWIPGTSEKRGIEPYDLVNRHIARRIRLLVHAGEIQREFLRPCWTPARYSIPSPACHISPSALQKKSCWSMAESAFSGNEAKRVSGDRSGLPA